MGAPANSSKKRPKGVDASAEWVEDETIWTWSKGVWMTGQRDGAKRVGPWKFQWADGTLAGLCTYKNGVREGSAQWFDPAGELAEEDIYVGGKQHGVQVFIRPTKKIEPVAAMWKAMPKDVMRMEMPYVDGKGIGKIFTLYNDRTTTSSHVNGRTKDLDQLIGSLVPGTVFACIAKDFEEHGEDRRRRAEKARYVLNATHVDDEVIELRIVPDDDSDPELTYVEADELARAFTLASDLYFAKR